MPRKPSKPTAKPAKSAKPVAKSSKGAIPRTKRAVHPAVKAAADRAEARAKGIVEPAPKAPINPPITRAILPAEHYAPKVEAEDTAPPGRGRPTLFKPEYVAMTRAMCKLGATDADLATEFDVTTQTIWYWQGRHKEFSDALKEGKSAWDDRVERGLAHRAAGYSYSAVKVMQVAGKIVEVPVLEHVPPDPNAAKAWLFNRRPKDWRDTKHIEHTGRDGGPIETSDTQAKIDLARWIAATLTAAPALLEVMPSEETDQ